MPSWYCPYCETGVTFIAMPASRGILYAGAPYCPLCQRGYLYLWQDAARDGRVMVRLAEVRALADKTVVTLRPVPLDDVPKG